MRRKFIYRWLVISLIAFLLLGVLSFFVFNSSRAASSSLFMEAEGGSVSGAATVGTDAAASGGRYIQFGINGPLPSNSPTGFFPRGMFETHDGTHVDTFKSLGFNAVNIAADKTALDTLQTKGMRGVVWLGDYDDATCQFQKSDATITSKVTAIKGHPAILAYYLVDEPEQSLEPCPNIGNQILARSNLVKSVDPAAKTYVVVSDSAYVAGHKREMYPYHYFVGKVDILGLDIYPCRQPANSSCDFANIDGAIAKVESLNVPRYWAILQDFEDTNWRRPTPDELKTQFDHWAPSRMEGYFIFSWDWQNNSLDGNTAHQDMMKSQNGRQF